MPSSTVVSVSSLFAARSARRSRLAAARACLARSRSRLLDVVRCVAMWLPPRPIPDGIRAETLLAFAAGSDDANVLGFVAFLAATNVELDALALIEGLVTVALDRGEVNEHVVAFL